MVSHCSLSGVARPVEEAACWRVEASWVPSRIVGMLVIWMKSMGEGKTLALLRLNHPPFHRRFHFHLHVLEGVGAQKSVQDRVAAAELRRGGELVMSRAYCSRSGC